MTAPQHPDPRIRRLQRLAWLMDDSIPVPVINRRIGLDSLIGLVPIVGDVIGGGIAAYILYSGYRLGASLATLIRMIGNVVLELIVGAVPLVGDLFDMGFKANQRNVALLLARERDEQRIERQSWVWTWLVLGTIALAILAALALSVWVAITALRALIGLF